LTGKFLQKCLAFSSRFDISGSVDKKKFFHRFRIIGNLHVDQNIAVDLSMSKCLASKTFLI
jgi:hypothetical protein